MAKISGNLLFTGSIGGLSAYKMINSDKIILRAKGGASKNKIKTAESFARTRELNAEWKGCTAAGKRVREAIYPVAHLADYNISGPVNAVCKKIQTLLDKLSVHGQRNILFSADRSLLEGFPLNLQHSFETIVRHPVSCVISRANTNALIKLPKLIQGIGFYNPWKYSLFRFIITAGIVPDLRYDSHTQNYKPVKSTEGFLLSTVYLNWTTQDAGQEAQSVELKPQEPFTMDDSHSLIVSVGIEFGIPAGNNQVTHIKRAGAAKIVGIG